MKRCFVIPVYNHPDTIAGTVRSLLQFELPIIVVDDGSDATTKTQLAALAAQEPSMELVTLPQNLGKGGAVMAGLNRAFERGFSHALQVDADGQHNLADIPLLWQHSAQQPLALVSGAPVYDDSIPTGRKIGRYITHFWVWVETLSFSVKDTMCGFRVYPLASCMQLFASKKPGLRMDFDIEVMVRLYWQQVPVLFVPTKVIYPEGGRSHFRVLQDNWLISKMHSRLFFGMLKRLPGLLWRKCRKTS